MDRVQQMTYKSGWKVAKVTPDITANPDLLLTHGSKRRSNALLHPEGGLALEKERCGFKALGERSVVPHRQRETAVTSPMGEGSNRQSF